MKESAGAEARSEAGSAGEGEVKGEAEMDARIEKVELEEEGFGADFEAGRDWEEREEIDSSEYTCSFP
jgi:hypothetical protein